MAVNEYVLDVDLKRSYSGRTPAFRRGDNGVLVFRVFDDGVEYNLNTVTKAEIYHETSKGTQLDSECKFITRNGKRLIQYQYEDIVTVELGYTQTILVLYSGNDIVSIRPFNVLVYTDLRGGAGSYLELIQELQKAIEETIDKLNDTVKLKDKGIPNGVASLDGSGKIPRAQLPKEVDVYLDHVDKSVSDVGGVHDFYVDEDGMGQYKTKNGDWQYIGFSDEAMTGGTLTLDASISIVNGVTTVTYTGAPTLASSKWAVGNREKTYFTTNGTSISNNKFNVANTGIHTLYYKDSNGVDYTKVFDVTLDMFNKPNVDIEITDGDVTVIIPSSVNVSVKRWAKGSQNITYFAFNGTTFTGNTFEVTEIGAYTVYVKTTGGLEYVYEFEVDESMLPSKIPISDGIFVEMETKSSNAINDNYKQLYLGLTLDSTVVKAVSSGHPQLSGISYLPISTTYTMVDASNEYRMTGALPFYNASSTNTNFTTLLQDVDGNTIHTLFIKTSSQYNYIVVDNSYILLTRIKTYTSNYTLPLTIEGLPVIGAGTAFFNESFGSQVGFTSIKNIVVPEQYQQLGRFAWNVKSLESIIIENPDLKAYIKNSMTSNSSNFKIYAPEDSSIYSQLSNWGHSVETF